MSQDKLHKIRKQIIKMITDERVATKIAILLGKLDEQYCKEFMELVNSNKQKPVKITKEDNVFYLNRGK